MKSFWKRTDERLLAASNWLWDMLGIDPIPFIERMTFKRIVLTAGFLVLAIGFAQILTADVEIGLATDTMLYFDVASAVFFSMAQQRVRHGAQAAVRAIRQTVQDAPVMLLRFCSRQRRNLSALRRKSGAAIPKQTDDERGAWDGALFAPA